MYQNIIHDREHLLSQISDLKEKLRQFPGENLYARKNGKYTKWFCSNGSNTIYLPKNKQPTAQALALKKYYSLQLEELSQQLELLEQYLSCCQEIEIKSTALFDESSDYKELLSSCLQEFPDELEDWIKADYGHNPNYPEHLLHKTLAGHNVRSKSEVIIANSLFINKIPYRYECALPLEDTVFYPDFTICHPQTLEIFYWEHFGMMDNHDYMVNSFNKLKLYASQNIIPSVNLITTFETLEHPLDSNKIQQIIQEYFL